VVLTYDDYVALPDDGKRYEIPDHGDPRRDSDRRSGDDLADLPPFLGLAIDAATLWR
jgi:hypothetical protein